MKATDLLEKDHAELEECLAQLARSTSAELKVRRQLIEDLADALEVHTEIEHEIFYPAVRALTGAEALVDHGEQQHQHVTDVLAEVLGMDPGAEEMDARIGDLRKAFREHVAEEEKGMFRRARDLGARELDGLGEELQHRKRALEGAAGAARRGRRQAA